MPQRYQSEWWVDKSLPPPLSYTPLCRSSPDKKRPADGCRDNECPRICPGGEEIGDALEDGEQTRIRFGFRRSHTFRIEVNVPHKV